MKSTLEAGTGAGETSTVDAEWIHPELEAAMLRDRMDPAPYLAYADWLQGQDEPRGWLIVLQHALRHRPSPPGHPMRRTVLPPAGKRAPPLENEAELLMDEQRFAHQHLFGWRVPMATHHPPFVRLRWQLGFVHDLVFRVGEAIGREPGLEPPVLADLLRQPSLRALWSMSLRFGAPVTAAVARALLSHPLPIESLALARADRAGTSLEFDGAALARSYPRLTQLHIRYGVGVDFRQAVLPELRTLELDTAFAEPWSGPVGQWPNLRTLRLNHVHRNAGDHLERLAEWLRARDFRQLKRLDIFALAPPDGIIDALLGSRPLRRLEALDLSMAPLTEQGVRQVLQHADQFRHLRTFALCTATEEQRDQLMQAIPRVRAQSQGRTL